MTRYLNFLCILLFMSGSLAITEAQQSEERLTLDRIFLDQEFKTTSLGPVKWMEGAYTRLESSANGARDIVKYDAETGERTVLVSADKLIPLGSKEPLNISDYSWATDGSKLMIFTNTRRVWRINTRGDYWVLDLKSGNFNN